jgi:hypothetical protein
MDEDRHNAPRPECRVADAPLAATAGRHPVAVAQRTSSGCSQRARARGRCDPTPESRAQSYRMTWVMAAVMLLRARWMTVGSSNSTE